MTHNFEKETIESGYIFNLIVADNFTMPFESTFNHSLDVSPLLDEFSDVMPDELLDKLPPLKDIQHAIDVVTGSQ